MHSADYKHVRSSVCLSDARILSKRSGTCCYAILIFPYQTAWQHFCGDRVTGASNARGYEKNRDFQSLSRFISETIQDRAIVIMEGE